MLRIALVTAVALLVVCQLAAAQTVVDRCSSDTQPNGTNLASALEKGGRITFNCPPNTSIRITKGHRVPSGTVIDGGNRVTLDAHGVRMMMFWVSGSGGSFGLERITIRNAKREPLVIPDPLGYPSVLRSFGNDVRLTDVLIEASEQPVGIDGNAWITGGGFVGNGMLAASVRGAAVVDQVRFINNGQGLLISGEALVSGARFAGNGTGLSLLFGRGTVRGTSFTSNTARALLVHYPEGKISIVGSSFSNNSGQGAVLLSQRSGRDGGGVVQIRRSTFSGNTGDQGGGAITIYDSTASAPPSLRPILLKFPPARFEFAYSRFSRNRGNKGGAIGADLNNTSEMVVRGGLFTENVANSDGGAISWVGRSVLITHSVFRANRAARGGALFAEQPSPNSNWTIANSLIAENVSDGAAIEIGPVALLNVTVAKNVGIGFVSSWMDTPLVANTIISQNSAGNCRFVSASAFQGSNLQFGHRDCPGVLESDPFLDALYVPALGSPVLSAGSIEICRSPPVSRTDILFQPRATGDSCALGAYEQLPLRRIPPKLQQKSNSTAP